MRGTRRAIRGGLVVLTIVALLLAPTGALAQEHDTAADHGREAGVENGAEQHGPTWTEYAFKWVNFFLLVGLLYWLLVVPPAFVIENFEFPGLKVVLAERAEAIVDARQLAQEQQAEAEARLTESAARLERVEREVDGLVAEASAAAETERQRIEAAAVNEAARIRDGAARDMKAQTVRARRELRRHVANLTVALAAGLVKENFCSEDQERIVRDYLERFSDTATAS